MARRTIEESAVLADKSKIRLLEHVTDVDTSSWEFQPTDERRAELTAAASESWRKSVNAACGWLSANPSGWDSIERAYYAYGTNHPRLHTDRVHFFPSDDKDHQCMWCGRTRRQVRFDDFPPECAEWREMPDIELTLAGEEAMYIKLLGTADKNMPKYWEKFDGNMQSIYETHGLPVDVQRNWAIRNGLIEAARDD